METGAVIVIILVAVFVLTECRSPEHQIPQPYRSECHTRMNECTRQLNANPFYRDAAVDLQGAVNNIDNICEDYYPAADCMKSSLSLCGRAHRVSMVEEMKMAESVCSEEGKSLMRAAQGSSCFQDANRFKQVLRNSFQCRSTPGQDYCQIKREIFACLARKVTDECGDAAGRFIDKVTSDSIPPQNECRSSSPSGVFKRSFEFLIKRR